MSNWQNALKAKNYTPENLGAAGQNGIKEYNELEVDLTELKSFEGQDGYDPKAVAAIEKELLKLDQKITKAIDIREFQLANIQKMQSARGKNKEPKVVLKAEGGNVETETSPIVETTKETTQTEPTVETENKKENNSGWGWFLGIAATVVAVVIGVNIKNR
jgi:hypothetical protein